jgi:hypothetical protein
LDLRSLEATLPDVLKDEYRRLKATLVQLKEGPGPDVAAAAGYDGVPGLKFLLKVNRTSNMAAGRVRGALASAELPFAEAQAALQIAEPTEIVGLALRGNFTGESVYYEGFESILRALANTRSRASLVRTKFALRQYYDEHGELSATLEVLVPQVLDSVPLDWMDGAPIRYDPARGVVWSIGDDLRDGGGDPSPFLRDDICLELGWIEAGASAE